MERIKALRNRLLDLTSRNRLLSFRYTKRTSLRIIDELPDQLCEMLMQERELRFLAVPEPTWEELIVHGYITVDPETGEEERLKEDPSAAEWAAVLGLDADYTLPLPTEENTRMVRHTDRAIQTLMYPYELEATLRAIRTKAQTAIEETGANILYLAFGFLEWYESKESDVVRSAPLFLVPVVLTKGRIDPASGTYIYTLAWTGEEIFSNFSLKEKLRVDFGLALPELDETQTPEGYWAEVEKVIETNQPRWRVLRHATLSLFNFSKLLMYLDLDPERWPEEAGLEEHPVLQSLMNSVEDSTVLSAEEAQEYAIDTLPQVLSDYPLIDDADSSQHSALIDAIDGKNLVIEGPPGTGKSQTITNLIAAALSRGKKVLFVAEKLAALEVVKHRLDLAGLGEFCLELHSHKAQKRKVLEELSVRIDNRGKHRTPEQIDLEYAEYESAKQELREYATLLHQQWKNTGWSIHRILMRATRYRMPHDSPLSQWRPDSVNGLSYTPETERRHAKKLHDYRHVYGDILSQVQAVSAVHEHPWYGLNNTELQTFDSDRVMNVLSKRQASLQAVSERLNSASQAFGVELLKDEERTEANLPELRNDFKRFAYDPETLFLESLPKLGDEEKAYAAHFVRLHGEVQSKHALLVKKLNKGYLGAEGLRVLRDMSTFFAKTGMVPTVQMTQLVSLTDDLVIVASAMKQLASVIDRIQAADGGLFEKYLTSDFDGMETLRQVFQQVSALDSALWSRRHDRFDDDALDTVLSDLQSRISFLRKERERVLQTFRLDETLDIDVLKQIRTELQNDSIFRWFSAPWRQARREFRSMLVSTEHSFQELLPQWNELIDYREKLALFNTNPSFKNFGEAFQGMETDVETLQQIRNWYKSVRDAFGVGISAKAAVGDIVISLPLQLAKGLQILAAGKEGAILDSLISRLQMLQRLMPRKRACFAEDVMLSYERGAFEMLGDDLREMGRIAEEVLNDPKSSVSECIELTNDMQNYQTLKQEYHEYYPGIKALFGMDMQEDFEPAHWEQSIRRIHTTLEQADLLANVKFHGVAAALLKEPTPERYRQLQLFGDTLETMLEKQKEAFEDFRDIALLDLSQWTTGKNETLQACADRNGYALKHGEWLSGWLEYVRARKKLTEEGLFSLVEAVEKQELSVDALESTYLASAFDLLAREVYREYPALQAFGGATLNAIRERFIAADERLKRLQREKIAAEVDRREVAAGYAGGKVSDYSELALIRHECGKKKRHISLRQLMRRAPKALPALKPCFMMGPMSVAQYLAPGEIEFDLLVMDEASQMKPEEALGAMARASQVVIVGDSKQLPPTSFFDRAVSDESDDSSSALEESESILDAAQTRFPGRQLRWHYRSRHESLIAFSNHAFYNDHLVVFPSPHQSSDEYGVKFVHVQKGRFVQRKNIEEASVIADAVAKHLLERPHESLGIVAMNVEQRDFIENSIEANAKDDPMLQEALERNRLSEEPLFVKNLENVQGDERDVIYISFTYGPMEVGGKVPQRFGPINAAVGWRRLNVLLTRSKKRMHVFSSMRHEHVLLSERSSRGVRAMRDFLEFAEKGRMSQEVQNGREPDSDFEIAVARMLEGEGFACEYQLGVAGYFIDIAVKDPGSPGRFLMGIECDGSTYHSAKSVRDRDRLRQSILEGLGWKIRRIWSTDWFSNPVGALAAIIEELHALKSEPIECEAMPEVAEIAQIATETEKTVQAVEKKADSEEKLRTELESFNNEVIKKELPDTPENKRLLRKAMVEALLEHRPLSRWEFLENIPAYLREGTAPEEAVYLKQVYEIFQCIMTTGGELNE